MFIIEKFSLPGKKDDHLLIKGSENEEESKNNSTFLEQTISIIFR